MHTKQGSTDRPLLVCSLRTAIGGSKRHQACCAHIQVRLLWVSASLQVYAGRAQARGPGPVTLYQWRPPHSPRAGVQGDMGAHPHLHTSWHGVSLQATSLAAYTHIDECPRAV